jgi:DNA mismatch endonuclease (patch repair protein)
LPTTANVDARNFKDLARWLIVQIGLISLNVTTPFRLHRKDLPGNPDLVFPSRKAVIFVHGCFWHQHPDPACRDARAPKSRQEYWAPKLARNVERDAAAITALKRMGWRPIVIWECETRDTERLRQQIQLFLGQDRS